MVLSQDHHQDNYSLSGMTGRSPIKVMVNILESVLPTPWFKFCGHVSIAHYFGDKSESIAHASCELFRDEDTWARLRSERCAFILQGLHCFTKAGIDVDIKPVIQLFEEIIHRALPDVMDVKNVPAVKPDDDPTSDVQLVFEAFCDIENFFEGDQLARFWTIMLMTVTQQVLRMTVRVRSFNTSSSGINV